MTSRRRPCWSEQQRASCISFFNHFKKDLKRDADKAVRLLCMQPILINQMQRGPNSALLLA